MTRIDVDAAHRILSENHPGNVPEAGDSDFQRRLAEAYALAVERAALTQSLDGYRATMRGFATMMGDKHIWSNMRVASRSVNWPGFLISRQGGDWVVGYVQQDKIEAPVLGARLISCDGLAAAEFAEKRLGGFRAVWSIEAQRISSAPFLMIDDGNPFIQRASQCVFKQDDRTQEVTLQWRPIAPAELGQPINEADRIGAPGLGVSEVASGYWISLETLSGEAAAVVAAVKAQSEALRQAEFVVLDLRGNGGGDSSYGDEIARLLTGETSVVPSTGSSPKCGVVWRTTDSVIRSIQEYQQREIELGRREPAAEVGRILEAARAAQTAGRSFSGPALCEQGSEEPENTLVQFPQRVILLTDHSCFSSCLLVTDLFRRKGALHVGETTDAATRYFEVREDTLPSGLSGFSTLQAMHNASPVEIGPFVPTIIFEGDISDTATLQNWIPTLID